MSEWSHYDTEHRESVAKVNSLASIRSSIKQALEALAIIGTRMDRRLEAIDREDRAADARDLDELTAMKRRNAWCCSWFCSGRWAAKREFNAMLKREKKELEDSVMIAVLPRRMHLAAEQQQKIIGNIYL